MKRLNLYEFDPQGRDLVSVARFREGPCCRSFFFFFFFERKCMRILSIHRFDCSLQYYAAMQVTATKETIM